MAAILSRPQCANIMCQMVISSNCTSQRTHGAIITSLSRQNDVAASFWRNNDVILATCVRLGSRVVIVLIPWLRVPVWKLLSLLETYSQCLSIIMHIHSHEAWLYFFWQNKNHTIPLNWTILRLVHFCILHFSDRCSSCWAPSPGSQGWPWWSLSWRWPLPLAPTSGISFYQSHANDLSVLVHTTFIYIHELCLGQYHACNCITASDSGGHLMTDTSVHYNLHPVIYGHLPNVVWFTHYGDIIMGAIASQITSLTIVYSAVYWDTDQRKHKSSASLAFVWGIHRGPVNSPHKWPVTRKMFLFDDVIMVRFKIKPILSFAMTLFLTLI